MASDISEAVNTLRDIGYECSNFLYVDGKGKNGIRKDMTVEECVEVLKRVEEWAFNQYRDTAYYLGWAE